MAEARAVELEAVAGYAGDEVAGLRAPVPLSSSRKAEMEASHAYTARSPRVRIARAGEKLGSGTWKKVHECCSGKAKGSVDISQGNVLGSYPRGGHADLCAVWVMYVH